MTGIRGSAEKAPPPCIAAVFGNSPGDIFEKANWDGMPEGGTV